MTVASNVIAVFLIGSLILVAGVFMFSIQTNDLDALYDYNKDIYQYKFVSNGFDAALRTTIPLTGRSLQENLANVTQYEPLTGTDEFDFPDLYTGESQLLHIYDETTKIFNEAFGEKNWYLKVIVKPEMNDPDIRLGTFRPDAKRISVERLIPLPIDFAHPERGFFVQVMLWVYEVKSS